MGLQGVLDGEREQFVVYAHVALKGAGAAKVPSWK